MKINGLKQLKYLVLSGSNLSPTKKIIDKKTGKKTYPQLEKNLLKQSVTIKGI